MIKKNNYCEVTKEWLSKANPKSNNIIHAKKYIDDDLNEYLVDNKKNSVFYNKKSKDYIETMACVKLFRNVFGGKLEVQPIVILKDGISTCDFKWIRPYEVKQEKWDLKTVQGKSNRTLDNMIKKKKRQSYNFIFDIKHHTITPKNAKRQIKHIFNDPHRDWVDKIILKDNDKIIAIYQKKRDNLNNL